MTQDLYIVSKDYIILYSSLNIEEAFNYYIHKTEGYRNYLFSVNLQEYQANEAFRNHLLRYKGLEECIKETMYLSGIGDL